MSDVSYRVMTASAARSATALLRRCGGTAAHRNI